jgi:Glyoxalase-like domain
VSGPTVVASALVVDCHDPGRLAEFWQSLLGGTTFDYPDFDVVALRAPGLSFDFVRVPDTKTSKNRWHLDLASNDPGATVQDALLLGAVSAADVCVSVDFTVLRDPEGNEFCVLHSANASAPWAPPE